jgi:hypothetical protein
MKPGATYDVFWQSTFLTFYLESWAFVISVSGLSLWAGTNGGDILIPN